MEMGVDFYSGKAQRELRHRIALLVHVPRGRVLRSTRGRAKVRSKATIGDADKG